MKGAVDSWSILSQPIGVNIHSQAKIFGFWFFSFQLLYIFGQKFLVHQKTQIVVATSNNNSNNQAPVPSVCVRVPHSPSLDSGDNSVPGSPVEKLQNDFATLVVREFVNPKKHKAKTFLTFQTLRLVCMQIALPRWQDMLLCKQLLFLSIFTAVILSCYLKTFSPIQSLFEFINIQYLLGIF